MKSLQVDGWVSSSRVSTSFYYTPRYKHETPGLNISHSLYELSMDTCIYV